MLLSAYPDRVRSLIGVCTAMFGVVILMDVAAKGFNHKCDARPVRDEAAVNAENERWERESAHRFAVDFRQGHDSVARFSQHLADEGLHIVDGTDQKGTP